MGFDYTTIDIVGKIFIDDNIIDIDERRNLLRKRAIDFFVKELPGTGNKEGASRHLYIAESFINGQKLCLQRPAHLKNGFDFLIYIPHSNINKNGKFKDAPSFNNIIEKIDVNIKDDLFKKSFITNIEKIFHCFEVTKFYNIEEEIILKTCKWLFIEQDIRYWHYSGRNKFYTSIKSKLI